VTPPVRCPCQAVEERCQRLGVPSLDLLQFYWSDYGVKNYVAAAKQLAELQAAGKIRHIGLTNFDVPRMQEFADAGVPIVSNQVRVPR
jgi:diketogulonate reductase-like aldo/keto reductase